MEKAELASQERSGVQFSPLCWWYLLDIPMEMSKRQVDMQVRVQGSNLS